MRKGPAPAALREAVHGFAETAVLSDAKGQGVRREGAMCRF